MFVIIARPVDAWYQPVLYVSVSGDGQCLDVVDDRSLATTFAFPGGLAETFASVARNGLDGYSVTIERA